MMKILAFALSVILTASCIVEKKETSDVVIPYSLIEVNNSSLKKAIIEYQMTIEKEIASNSYAVDSVYVGVLMSDINRSAKQYILYPITKWSDIQSRLPFFVCSVNGHDVFFQVLAGCSVNKEHYGVFKLDDESQHLLRNRYFPNSDYEGSINKIDSCRLTFLEDSLTSVSYMVHHHFQ